MYRPTPLSCATLSMPNLMSRSHFLCRHLFPVAFITGILAALLLMLCIQTTQAGSATWDLNPGSGDWNTAANWTPTTVPNGSADTATFGLSNTTDVSLSANMQVNSITFTPAATSSYTITANPGFTLTISGAGITNNSGTTQNFVTAVDGAGNLGQIVFTNSATAGNSTIFMNSGGVAPGASGAAGGRTDFLDTSTAGSATITNLSGATGDTHGGLTAFGGSSTAGSATITNYGEAASDLPGGSAGETDFGDTSTAGSATITNMGGATSGARGAFLGFYGASTAGSATIINLAGANGAGGGLTSFRGEASTAGSATIINLGNGATTEFHGSSTAGSATIINNGGQTIFWDDSDGGTSQVEVFGNGNLDVSFHYAPGVAVGSIEGDGRIFLGANNLTVGSNNLSKTFSGVMQDGGIVGGAGGGSLTKNGAGTLTLSGANTYTGGTTLNAGILLVNNTTGSGTGSGAVHVNAGTLGGTGTIAGPVTIGTGSGHGASLSPGPSLSAGTLTIQSTLTLNADATYQFELNRHTRTADEVIADGVTINGAQFSLTDLHGGALTPGTVFTLIDNTAASLIAGVFSNLPDDSMFRARGNIFEVSYEGGNGNDLTLTATRPNRSVPDGGVTWVLLALSVMPLLSAARYSRRH